jgi:hypothetical protein
MRVLEAVEAPDAPEAMRTLPSITTLRRTWQRHYARPAPSTPMTRYRHKRDTQWTGYMVHVSETCEPTAPHLMTHVHTTAATVHEAQCTTPIHNALLQKELAPTDIRGSLRLHRLLRSLVGLSPYVLRITRALSRLPRKHNAATNAVVMTSASVILCCGSPGAWIAVHKSSQRQYAAILLSSMGFLPHERV